MPKEDKILITGGHLTPALLSCAEMISNGFSNITWVGVKHTQRGDTSTTPEYQLVSELKVPFIQFNTGKLWRKWNKFTYKQALIDLLLIPYGFINAFKIILNEQPKLIFSFGGYMAVPFVLAGKLLGKKVITHEQVLSPGLASKIISRFADRILVSWEENLIQFDPEKSVLTGNPSILNYNKTEEKINFNNDLPIVTIIGGNQGSHIVNTAVFAGLEEILKFTNLIHQTGRSEVTKDKYRASDEKTKLEESLSERYFYTPYISEELNEVFEKSDLIVARGGANTMTDIILKGKKCIIIPIPWSSGDEQKINAVYLEKLGLASIIEYENEINPELLTNEIRRRLFEENPIDKEKLKKLQNQIRYATPKILKEVEQILNNN